MLQLQACAFAHVVIENGIGGWVSFLLVSLREPHGRLVGSRVNFELLPSISDLVSLHIYEKVH